MLFVVLSLHTVVCVLIRMNVMKQQQAWFDILNKHIQILKIATGILCKNVNSAGTLFYFSLHNVPQVFNK